MKTFQSLLLIITIFFSINSSAQNFSFVDDTVKVWGSPGDYFSGETDIINNKNIALNLRVKTIQWDVPEAWDLTYCGMWCGTDARDSIDMLLTANATQFNRIKGYSGSKEPYIASLTMVVLNIDNPSEADTCVYIYNTKEQDPTTGINELTSNPIQIFPNPVAEQINIQVLDNNNNQWIEVYNQQGQKVIAQSFSGKVIYQLPVEELPEGRYFIQYLNSKGVRFTNSFIKIK